MKIVFDRHTYAERQPGETANDRNDRAIRKAVAWYADHLKDTEIEVVLITNDADNRKQSVLDGLKAYTSKSVDTDYNLADMPFFPLKVLIRVLIVQIKSLFFCQCKYKLLMRVGKAITLHNWNAY